MKANKCSNTRTSVCVSLTDMYFCCCVVVFAHVSIYCTRVFVYVVVCGGYFMYTHAHVHVHE